MWGVALVAVIGMVAGRDAAIVTGTILGAVILVGLYLSRERA
jgi:hypothetical protein